MKHLTLVRLVVILACTQCQIGCANAQFLKKNEVVKSIQGRWVLSQNERIKVYISKDTLLRLYDGKSQGQNILRVCDFVISKTFANDTIVGKKGQFFLEEIDISTGEVEFQYSILSLSKKKFVLSPLHSGEILTYDKIK